MRQKQGNPQIEVSVVIPAHNEEANIGPLLDEFEELFRSARFSLEVVLVDDGSTDRTMTRALELQRTHRFLRLVSLPCRRGLTEALRAGFAVARGGIIVFYPADRQFHSSDIPRMIDKLREGYDLVTGRKIGEYDKRVVSSVYNRLSRLLFRSIPVTDLNSVKAFRRELTSVFDYRHDWHRFWVAIIAEAGYRVGEVDVTLYKRRAGKSKFGFWRIPGGVLDLLAVKFQYHTMRRPLWYFGMTGSVLLIAAFCIGLWTLYQRFVEGVGYRPLLYLVMTLGISGIVFFALGFLAESVAGIREQLELLRGVPRHAVHPSPKRSQPARSNARRASEGTSAPAASQSRTSSGERRQRRSSGESRRDRPDRRRTPPPHRRADERREAERVPAPTIHRRVLGDTSDTPPVTQAERLENGREPEKPRAEQRAETHSLNSPQTQGASSGLIAESSSANDTGGGPHADDDKSATDRHDIQKSGDSSTPDATEKDEDSDKERSTEREPRLFGRRNRR